MKTERFSFVRDWLEKLRDREHLIIYRTKEEAYHKHCVNIRYREYTELIFWGCYTSELKGPSYMSGKETTKEEEAAKEDLITRNSNYLAQK